MRHEKLKVVALISGGGSNLQALIQDSQHDAAGYQITGDYLENFAVGQI